jgi:hypothetical protein
MKLFATAVLLISCASGHEQNAPDKAYDSEQTSRKSGVQHDAGNGTVISRSGRELAGFFSVKDAEAILGEPVLLADSSFSGSIYQSAYKALKPDKPTGRTGAIYCLIENYPDSGSAHLKYRTTYEANKGHDGVKVLERTGDEAYFHTDETNFYFIMVRRSRRVFILKVNKITSHTSLEAFHSVSKRIAGDL